MMSHVQILWLISISIFSYIHCSCITNGLYRTEIMENGETFYRMYHIVRNSSNFEISCFYSAHRNLSLVAVDVFIVLSNATHEHKKTDLFWKQTLAGVSFQFNLTEDDFKLSKVPPLFLFPEWHVKVFSQNTTDIIFSGSILRISKDITNFFSISTDPVSDGKEYLTVSSPCVQDVDFSVGATFSNGVSPFILRVNGNDIGRTYLQHDVNTTNASLGKVIVTSQTVFIFFGGEAFSGKIKKSEKNLQLKSITGIGEIEDIFSSPQCHTWEQEGFETIMLKTNRSFMYSRHPFHSWTVMGKEVLDGLNLTSIVYDIERRNFVLLLTWKNQIATKWSTVVLAENGQLFCSVFVFPEKEEFTWMKYDIDSGMLLVKGRQMYKSIDGGCLFSSDVHIHQLRFDAITYHSRNVIQLHQYQDENSNPREFFDKSYLWSYYGMLRSDFTTDGNMTSFPFYLNRALPTSTHWLTKSGLCIELNSDFNARISLLKPRYIWNNSVKNRTVTCISLYISCFVKEQINATHLNATCRHLGASKLTHQRVTCAAGMWFVNELYSAKKECQYLNTTSNQIDIRNSSLKTELITDGIFVSSKGLEAIVSANTGNGFVNLSIIKGAVDQGLHRFCFDISFESVTDVLFRKEPVCPLMLYATGMQHSMVTLEAFEEKIVEIRLVYKEDYPVTDIVRDIWLLDVRISNPKQFDVRSRYWKKRNEQKVTVKLRQKWLYKSMTTLVITTRISHEKCRNLTKSIVIVGDCPSNKRLVFQYPNEIKTEDFVVSELTDVEGVIRVFNLPTNYQPPSLKGRAIPMTTNVYNADPVKPMHHKKYLETQIEPEFKQCRGKKNRNECGCSVTAETSTKMENSDCINRVYRIIFSEKLVPDLLVQRGSENVSLEYPYYIIELNNRTDYELADTLVTSDGQTAMSLSNGSSIQFTGTGLYHFRIEVAVREVSFCNLTTEFIVYSDKAPLVHPVEDLVRVTTSIAFATVILAVFLAKYYR